MNLKRIVLRSWFYFRQGYSLYLSYPVSFAAYATSVYYLAVKNIPFLEMLFPHFHTFIIVALFALPIVGIALGWAHFKRLLSPFFRAEVDIGVEANPYAMEIMTPVNLPWMHVLSELAKQHGIDTEELDKIISRTEKKFNVMRV